MKTWHPPIVDFLRRHLPSDSFIRPYAKRIVEDARSVLHSGRDWTFREQAPPETLFLETTNICNADCVFCAYQYQDRFRSGKGVMADEIFEKALADYIAFTSGPAERHVNFTPLTGSMTTCLPESKSSWTCATRKTQPPALTLCSDRISRWTKSKSCRISSAAYCPGCARRKWTISTRKCAAST